MSRFENVTIIKNANIYFDGKVTSRTIVFADGSTKTLGVMLPGEYEFGTDKKELMEILAGRLEVMLPNATDWEAYKDGDSFEVPEAAKFQLKVKETTDYCCSYID